ncbi:MAG: GSU2204 family CXXCH-containing (seleno)protein [Acidobacteriota bacterium]
MKKIIILITIISLVVLLPLSAEDTEKEKKGNVDAKLSFGVVSVGKSDSMVKTKEYCPVDDGVRPFVKASLVGNINKMFFNMVSKFNGDITDQSHVLNFDFDRVLKQNFTFDSLHHRLDHDPLTNMDVVSHARSAAYAEDFNPTDQYYINRSEFVSNSQISLPMLPGVKFYVKYRNEQRTGMYQARTLSKCSACHVVAKSRSINSYNKDVQIGTKIRIGKGNIDYSFTNNRFKERNSAPQSYYLKIEHPEKIVPVFTSRIGIGNEESLSFDNIPESKKDTHLLKASIPVAKNTFFAQYVNSQVKNLNANLKWNSSSFGGSYSGRLGNKGFFNVLFLYQKIDNDSIFIDIVEPLDVTTGNVGKTYADGILGIGTFDFTRLSALSRSVLDLKANFRYKLSKSLKLRLGYEYENVERDNFEVSNTKSSTVKGRISFKPAKQFKLVLDGKFATISDPFANLKGGIAPAVQLYKTTSPLLPDSTQFYYWHMAREGTMTNYPEGINEIKGRIHWGPSSKFALNGNFLIRKEDNDDLVTTGASWNRDLFQWGIDMWASLSKKMPLSISYYNYSNTYSTLFAIPVIEGCGAGIIGGMPGTLTDMMDLETQTKTLLVNLSYWASKKFTLFANFNYNNSSSIMKNLALNESDVPFLPGSGGTALDFNNMNDTAEYSKLDMKQIITQFGLNYKLSKQWWMNGSFYYYLYDDYAKYLYTDTTGKSYSFYIGFTWKN